MKITKRLTIGVLVAAMWLSSPVLAEENNQLRIEVNGLVCDFCARALEKVFSKQQAVQKIDVDLDTKLITVHFNDGQTLDDETITQLVTDSGYDVRKIHRDE